MPPGNSTARSSSLSSGFEDSASAKSEAGHPARRSQGRGFLRAPFVFAKVLVVHSRQISRTRGPSWFKEDPRSGQPARKARADQAGERGAIGREGVHCAADQTEDSGASPDGPGNAGPGRRQAYVLPTPEPVAVIASSAVRRRKSSRFSPGLPNSVSTWVDTFS